MRLKRCHQPAAGRVLCVICNKLIGNGNRFQYSLSVYNSGLDHNARKLSECLKSCGVGIKERWTAQ